MGIDEMRAIVAECSMPEYAFLVKVDGRGVIYLQGSYSEQDVDTFRHEMQWTRRWFLSPEMTKSEIVQTVFKCVMTSYEHRAREWFRYRGRSVFGPHFNVDVLWDVCQKTDKRPT